MNTVSEKIQFIEQNFGECNIARDGTNVAVKCPHCCKIENKRKFSICLDSWRYHCWVCGLKGKNLYYILKKYRSQLIAQNYLDKFNLKSQLELSDKARDDQDEAVELPRNYMMVASNMTNRDPDFKAAVSYLASRGVTLEKMWYHKIGTVITGGFWNRRIIFPSFNDSFKLDYYVSRAIDDDTNPKYLNAKADKRNIIFDEMRLKWNEELIIVEGVFDMIKSTENVACLLGSYLTEKHRLFQKIVANKTPVLLALDNDVRAKCNKIAQLLYLYDIPVRIMNTDGYDDVGVMTLNEFNKRSQEAYTYTSDSRLDCLIESIKSGSVF